MARKLKDFIKTLPQEEQTAIAAETARLISKEDAINQAFEENAGVLNRLAANDGDGLLKWQLMTLDEVADGLNYSTKYLEKIIVEGAFDCLTSKDGTLYIRRVDFEAYDTKLHTERRKLLRDLTQYSEEIGLYDDDDEVMGNG